MKKVLSVLLCLMLLLPAAAFAQARMPELHGTVTDDANVLSAQTVSDLSAYAEKLSEQTQMDLHIAIVHFLDGMDAQSYANALFAKWELDDNDLLLLGAAGEDTFATVLGAEVQKQLGSANAENLMFTSSAFGRQFSTQQYDAAFASWCTALNTLVEKQLNESIRMDGLFGQTASSPIQQVQSYGSELWGDVMQSITDSNEDYYERLEERWDSEDDGLSAGGWIVLIILVMVMLRRNKYERHKRPGCTGWLFSLLGVNLLADLFRRRRHKRF